MLNIKKANTTENRQQVPSNDQQAPTVNAPDACAQKKDTSQRRIQANRRNALLSTGPGNTQRTRYDSHSGNHRFKKRSHSSRSPISRRRDELRSSQKNRAWRFTARQLDRGPEAVVEENSPSVPVAFESSAREWRVMNGHTEKGSGFGHCMSQVTLRGPIPLGYRFPAVSCARPGDSIAELSDPLSPLLVGGAVPIRSGRSDLHLSSAQSHGD